MATSTFDVQVAASPELKGMVDQAERLIGRVASMTPAQLAEMKTGQLFLEAHQRAERLAALAAALLAKLPRCSCGCGVFVGASSIIKDGWRDEAAALESEVAAQRAAVEAMKAEATAARAAAPIELEGEG